MPSAIQAMSRRYEFWKTPDDLQKAADRMSGKATWQLYAHEADSAWNLMCCHTVKLTISLSVGFLDSLHDPSAYVAPHDISDAVVPVNEHLLPAPPDSFRVPDVELQLLHGT